MYIIFKKGIIIKRGFMQITDLFHTTWHSILYNMFKCVKHRLHNILYITFTYWFARCGQPFASNLAHIGLKFNCNNGLWLFNGIMMVSSHLTSRWCTFKHKCQRRPTYVEIWIGRNIHKHKSFLFSTCVVSI